MKRRLVLLGLAATAAVLAARFLAHEWLTVDACYDAGGVYLEELSKCSYSQEEVDRYRRIGGQ